MPDNLHKNLIRKFFSGQIDRRKFLTLSLQAVSGACITSIVSCTYRYSGSPPELNSIQDQLLSSVLNLIFPGEQDSPGASDLNAVPYFHLVLLDTRVAQSEKELLQNGLLWIEEESEKQFGKKFLSLSLEQQQELLKRISEFSWGENWLSLLLNYLFEALLGDPVYGINPDGIGWKWLEHTPGYPRPNKGTTI